LTKEYLKELFKEVLDDLDTKCQVKACQNAADFKIEYDVGDSSDQILSICKDHYESYDELENSEKFYYFKKFVKNIFDF